MTEQHRNWANHPGSLLARAGGIMLLGSVLGLLWITDGFSRLSGFFRGLPRPELSASVASPSASFTFTEGSPAQTITVEPLRSEHVEQLRGLIVPKASAQPWGQVPWLTNLTEARKRAAVEGKPLLLWQMDGHPLGCTSANGIASRTLTFSDPDVLRLVADQFVPVAIDDWYERHRDDPEGEFFRRVFHGGAAQTRLAANDCPANEGIYCLTPSGRVLGGFGPSPNGKALSTALRGVLSEYGALPADQRQPINATVADRERVDARYRRTPPPNGLIVTVFTRALDGTLGGDLHGVGSGIGRDHLWLTKAEKQALMPLHPRRGERVAMPAAVAERLLRFHLVDNTRGQPTPWSRDHLRFVEMTLTVEDTVADRVQVRVEGAALLACVADIEDAELGYQVRLLGNLRYNARTQEFERFDLVAFGNHWGEGALAPGARPGRTPLGVVFELATGTAPLDLVPPFAARYPREYLGVAVP